MTTAPNIEMIASSLQHCSLNGGGGDRRLAGRSGGGDDSESVTVELNSDIALPYHWEQCLDIRTGQVYYINWEDGRRTTVDPRTLAFTTSPTPRSTSLVARLASSPSSGFTSVSSVGAEASAWPQAGDVDSGYDNDNEEDEEEEDEEEEEEESSSSSSSLGSVVSSTLSSFSPTDESASVDNGSAIATGSDNNNGGTAGHVLVAAGCRACFMYFMVPKGAEVCPKCGSSGLLHLSRNGSA